VGHVPGAVTRRIFVGASLAAAAPVSKTTIAIDGERFLLNGKPTYAARVFRGMKIEGLLMNSRMVQGIFDDRNPETQPRWRYPDTGRWDPERNTDEFVAAMPEWRAHGLLSFTINIQGGSPEGYSKNQPWDTGGFLADGSLRPEYLARLKRILDRADQLGMAPIVGYYYFGQDEKLRDESAVKRGVVEATNWLLDRGYRNVLVEINNECDVPRYDHEILKPQRVPELIGLARSITRDGQRLLVSASYGGGKVPHSEVVAASDFVLLHGNGVKDPERIAEMVRQTRRLPGYKPKPILFNEDDHFDFDRPANNMLKAVGEYASWGYFDPEGYQTPPVNWRIDTPRKRAFFGLLKDMTAT
jgi:hypothetical protein